MYQPKEVQTGMMGSDSLRFNKQSVRFPVWKGVHVLLPGVPGGSRSLRSLPSMRGFLLHVFITERQKEELSYLKIRRVARVISLLMVSNKVILQELTSAPPTTIRRL